MRRLRLFKVLTNAESGPGWARFTSKDKPEDVERKMADAFAPVDSMREALRQLEAEEEEKRIRLLSGL